MKPELIAIVKQLKEKKEAQDVYFQTIPTDLRVSVIDNKYVNLLEAMVQILTDKVFEGVEEDMYWFLYDFEAGKTNGPHIIDATGQKYTFKTNKAYYKYLEGVE
jgi:hypothetical protein